MQTANGRQNKRLQLVGFPDDVVLDFDFCDINKVASGVHNILAAGESLFQADLTIVYPDPLLFSLPKETDGAKSLLRLLMEAPLLEQWRDAHQDLSDSDFLLWLRNNHFYSFVTCATVCLDQCFRMPPSHDAKHTIAIFLPADAAATDSFTKSIWQRWLCIALEKPVTLSMDIAWSYGPVSTVAQLAAMYLQTGHKIVPAVPDVRSKYWDHIEIAFDWSADNPLLASTDDEESDNGEDNELLKPIFYHGSVPIASMLDSSQFAIYFLPELVDTAGYTKDLARYLLRERMDRIPPSIDLSRYGEYLAAKKEVDGIIAQKGIRNPLVGRSPALLAIYPQLLDAMRYPRSHVLVCGETGAGKEVIYALLKMSQPGPDAPFIVPQHFGMGQLLADAVFGHVPGAHDKATFDRAGAVETASGGTLVLDNVQEADPDFFRQFLRLLEPAQEYQKLGDDKVQHAHCRIVVGCNESPEALISEGRMPEDWLQRFSIRIDLPPLDDRKGDIPELVEAFVSELWEKDAKAHSLPLESLRPPSQLVEKWQRRSWAGSAGNVRGLHVAVEKHFRALLRPMPAGGKEGGRSRDGRPKGSTAIPDAELAGLLHSLMNDPSAWSAEKLFDQIDKRISASARPPVRTPGALVRRSQRISKEAIHAAWGKVDNLKELRSSITKAIEKLWELPAHETSAGTR